MLYRPYGSTGKQVSLVGFGGMRFREIDNREANVALLVEAAQAGINYFDTAQSYFHGRSEEIFGEAFDELRRLVIPFYCATKTFKSVESEIRAEIEAQLKRLRLSTIDFYHVWCVTGLTDWRERKTNRVIDTFLKLKEEGVIRHICVSSHLIGEDIQELLREQVFEGVLFGYSAATFPFRETAFDIITQRNIGAVVMNPLGGGVIPDNPQLFSFVKTRENESIVEAALRFLFAHERISSVLVGFRDRHDLPAALSAVYGYRPISPDQFQRIKNSIGPALRDLCTGCRYCENCPESVPIPELMDAYNFRLLYDKDQRVLDRMRWHWNLSPEAAARCIDCGQCEDVCTQHLPIVKRLHELAELQPNPTL